MQSMRCSQHLSVCISLHLPQGAKQTITDYYCYILVSFVAAVLFVPLLLLLHMWKRFKTHTLFGNSERAVTKRLGVQRAVVTNVGSIYVGYEVIHCCCCWCVCLTFHELSIKRQQQQQTTTAVVFRRQATSCCACVGRKKEITSSFSRPNKAEI